MNFWFDAEKKINKKKIVITVILIILVLSIIATIVTYILNEDFREWADVNLLQKELGEEDVTTIEFNSDSNAEVCAYNNYIGILSENTFNIYNSSGKEEASLEVPINNVLFNSCNSFLGIAENGGQKVYLISGKSIAWENEIEGNISKIVVNKNGYMAVAITNTSYKTVISLFNPSGKELFKIYLSSTRVESFTISNDNKYLALAEIDTSSSVIQSNVKVVSIENAQTDTDNSIIYIYNADSNKLLTNIKYQDKNKLVCMYDDSICIIENEENTELINFSDRDVDFYTIMLNNNVALIEEKSSGLFTADSEITFISTTNGKETMYTIEDVAKEIYSCENILGLNLGSELHFINTGGWLVKRYIANQEISSVVMSDSIAGVIYRNKIEVIDL